MDEKSWERVLLCRGDIRHGHHSIVHISHAERILAPSNKLILLNLFTVEGDRNKLMRDVIELESDALFMGRPWLENVPL